MNNRPIINILVQYFINHFEANMSTFPFSVKELSKVSHVRLDRENIGFIDNLELMSSKVTNLYLQNVGIFKLDH